MQNCPTQCQQSTIENNWSVILTTNLIGLKSNSSIFKVCTTSDKQISRTFQEFFKDKLQFSTTTIFLLNRRHSLTPFDHPIGQNTSWRHLLFWLLRPYHWSHYFILFSITRLCKMTGYDVQLHLRCRNSIVTCEFYRLSLTPRMSRIFLGKII